MNLETLMAKHVAALGGAERIRGLRSAHMEYDVEVMTIRGTSKEWSQADGKYRVELDLPVARQTDGYNGWVEWSLDMSGQLKVRDKPRDPKLPMVLPDFQYLFPSEAIEVEYRGADGEGEDLVYKIEVRQEGEEPRLVEIDGHSFLVRRVRTRQENMNVTIEYDEYHPVDGVLVAHRYAQQVDMPGAPRIEFSLSLARFDEELPPVLFDPPPELVKDYEFAEGGRSEGIPISVSDNHLFMKVRLDGGEPLDFLIDTGAGRTVISKRVARAMGLQSRGEIASIGVGGTQNVEVVRVSTLSVPGLTLKDQTLFALDLSDLEPFVGRRIDGVLGYDLFARAVTRIDYVAKTISFYDPAEYLYEGLGERLRGKLVAGLLQVPGELEGRWKGEFRIDTGSNGALHLHEPFVRRSGLLAEDRKFHEIEAMGVGGVAKVRTTRMKSLRLASFEIPDVPADISLGGQGALAVEESIGTIGNQILSRFTLILDYRHEELILEPNIWLERPFPKDRGGFAVVKRGDAIVVHQVFEDSPAEEAGLQPGDELVSVNKMPANGFSLADIRALFRGEPGTKMVLVVRREGERKKLKFKLADYR
jgi:predicted aspartyl protease